MIQVNGEPLDHRPGMTVHDVLQARRFLFPLVIVRIDGRVIPRSEYATTEVPDGAVVEVVHLMSGG